ncbi:MAG: 16S rRNA (adenine(1518)-N(6)/adenine(1519)-N(6))-dimethyltransferase RsmA [Rickettsiales bacterium]|jgi:16S rRNA (adenine1518-N6/adenine1519-N6)-dimethyltransferase|nr:16S rRNA (adenine(1518)-N(6)/adenine(1519)-N(6))-dimethyltransferase RsmA [Rickettsiales bacterium]
MLTTAEIIKKYNLYTKKSLGQNFLTDTNLLAKIVKCAGNIENENILEIGTGPAGLTTAILDQNPKKLVTIDTDVRCEDIIRNEIKPYFGILEFRCCDALKIDENEFFQDKFTIISNLPYNIGVTLLLKWLNNTKNINDIILLLQKEVVERIVAKAKTKEYGSLSVICQYLCDVKKYFDIPPGAFYPAPKVISSVIGLTPKKEVDQQKARGLFVLCKILFGQRRKTILNNLKNTWKNAESCLAKIGIDGKRRGEELSVEEIAMISEYYLHT